MKKFKMSLLAIIALATVSFSVQAKTPYDATYAAELAEIIEDDMHAKLPCNKVVGYGEFAHWARKKDIIATCDDGLMYSIQYWSAGYPDVGKMYDFSDKHFYVNKTETLNQKSKFLEQYAESHYGMNDVEVKFRLKKAAKKLTKELKKHKADILANGLSCNGITNAEPAPQRSPLIGDNSQQSFWVTCDNEAVYLLVHPSIFKHQRKTDETVVTHLFNISDMTSKHVPNVKLIE